MVVFMSDGQRYLDAKVSGDDHPILDLIAAKMAAVKNSDLPDITDLFEEVCCEFSPTRLTQILRGLKDRPTESVLQAVKNGVVLSMRPKFSIDVSIIVHSPAHLYWHPRHTWYRVLGGDAELAFYKLPSAVVQEVVDPNVTLDRYLSRQIRPGDTFIRDGRCDVVDIVSSSTRPLVLLRLHGSRVGEIEWMFGRNSLRPIGATAMNPNDSHLLNLIYASSKIGDQESISHLLEAMTHPQHFVRWAAVQAIGRLSREAALAALKGAAEDPHPHVRAKARKVLARAKVAVKAEKTDYGAYA